jgi:hypothetical protein
MAWVLQKFVASFNIVDTSGRKVNRRYDLNTTDPNTAFNSMNSIRDRMASIITAKIMSYQLERIFVDNAFALPVAADNRNTVVFSALLSGEGDARAKISLPAPHPGVFLGTTGAAMNAVNFANSGVDIFVKLFGTGPWGSAHAKISDGQLIILDDMKGWRQHKKT